MRCLFHLPILLSTALLSLSPGAGGAAPPPGMVISSVESGEKDITQPYWIGVFGSSDTAAVCVKLQTITSISKHSYLIDNKIPVKEVTIDTLGNHAIRIYCFHHPAEEKLGEKLSNTRSLARGKMSGASAPLPGKKYPEGTCSHNVEFLITDGKVLDDIYQSLITAWATNQGCTFRTL